MLKDASKQAKKVIKETIGKTKSEMKISEISTIVSISSGTAEVSGLSKVKMNELLNIFLVPSFNVTAATVSSKSMTQLST